MEGLAWTQVSVKIVMERFYHVALFIQDDSVCMAACEFELQDGAFLFVRALLVAIDPDDFVILVELDFFDSALFTAFGQDFIERSVVELRFRKIVSHVDEIFAAIEIEKDLLFIQNRPQYVVIDARNIAQMTKPLQKLHYLTQLFVLHRSLFAFLIKYQKLF